MDAPLRSYSLYLRPTTSDDLNGLSCLLDKDDNTRLFQYTYGTDDIPAIIATHERRENTYTVCTNTTGNAIGWVLFRLLDDRLECTQFIERCNGLERSLELMSLTGYLAFEQLRRPVLDVKVVSRDQTAGDTARKLGNSLIGVIARQGLVPDAAQNREYALYRTRQEQWSSIKTAVDAWLSQP